MVMGYSWDVNSASRLRGCGDRVRRRACRRLGLSAQDRLILCQHVVKQLGWAVFELGFKDCDIITLKQYVAPCFTVLQQECASLGRAVYRVVCSLQVGHDCTALGNDAKTARSRATLVLTHKSELSPHFLPPLWIWFSVLV